MAPLPTLEQWQGTLAHMVAFHQEQALVWLWLPTPSNWIEDLKTEQTSEQSELRALLVPPGTAQPQGLTWHAWDTRDSSWLLDEHLLLLWYSHWVRAHQVSMVK